VLERLGLELAWSGASSAAPAHPDDTTHLERLVFADRPLQRGLLEAVIALG
jgi:ribosomal-protein-alanine N-acetyltransferase